jgi:hypothetical protein
VRLHSNVLILREGSSVRTSLVVTSLQENVRKPTLAVEMEVDPWGVLDRLNSIEVIVKHSPKLWPNVTRKLDRFHQSTAMYRQAMYRYDSYCIAMSPTSQYVMEPSRHVLHCHVTHTAICDGTITPRIPLPSLIAPRTHDLLSQIHALSRDLLDHTR